MPPDMNKDMTQINMVRPEPTVDGKVWSQNNGFAAVHRLDLKTGQIETIAPFKNSGIGENHNIYDIIPDSQNNAYFTDFAQEHIGRIDAQSGKVTMYQVPTPKSAPRRGMMDEQDRLWFAEYRGNKIAMFDTKAEKFQEWAAPTPWSLALRHRARQGWQRLDRLDAFGPRAAARSQERAVRRIPVAEDDEYPPRVRRQWPRSRPSGSAATTAPPSSSSSRKTKRYKTRTERRKHPGSRQMRTRPRAGLRSSAGLAAILAATICRRTTFRQCRAVDRPGQIRRRRRHGRRAGERAEGGLHDHHHGRERQGRPFQLPGAAHGGGQYTLRTRAVGYDLDGPKKIELSDAGTQCRRQAEEDAQPRRPAHQYRMDDQRPGHRRAEGEPAQLRRLPHAGAADHVDARCRRIRRRARAHVGLRPGEHADGAATHARRPAGAVQSGGRAQKKPSGSPPSI